MDDQFLNEFKKQPSGYRVPPAYFEQRKASLKAIAGEAPAPARREWWSLAVGMAAALLIGFFALKYQQPALDQVAAHELENYLINEYSYPLLLESNTEELGALDLNPETGLSEDALDDYLNENYDEYLQYDYL